MIFGYTPRQVAKAIAAFLAAVATWGGTAILDGQIDGVEWFGLLGVLAAALLVFATPNAPSSE